MLTSAIKKQTSVCCSISLNPYNMVFQTCKFGITKKKKEKRKAIIWLAYTADVSCLTNRPFYMRTLSLNISFGGLFMKMFCRYESTNRSVFLVIFNINYGTMRPQCTLSLDLRICPFVERN